MDDDIVHSGGDRDDRGVKIDMSIVIDAWKGISKCPWSFAEGRSDKLYAFLNFFAGFYIPVSHSKSEHYHRMVDAMCWFMYEDFMNPSSFMKVEGGNPLLYLPRKLFVPMENMRIRKMLVKGGVLPVPFFRCDLVNRAVESITRLLTKRLEASKTEESRHTLQIIIDTYERMVKDATYIVGPGGMISSYSAISELVNFVERSNFTFIRMEMLILGKLSRVASMVPFSERVDHDRFGDKFGLNVKDVMRKRIMEIAKMRSSHDRVRAYIVACVHMAVDIVNYVMDYFFTCTYSVRHGKPNLISYPDEVNVEQAMEFIHGLDYMWDGKYLDMPIEARIETYILDTFFDGKIAYDATVPGRGPPHMFDDD
jgi:hypothetical protein